MICQPKGGSILDIMHGRRLMTIDPCMPERSTLGCHRPGRQWLLAPSARRNVRCQASRMKGELHPTKNRYGGGCSCLWMTASMSKFNIRCRHFQRVQWRYYATPSWVPHHEHYQVRYTIIPLQEGGGVGGLLYNFRLI